MDSQFVNISYEKNNAKGKIYISFNTEFEGHENIDIEYYNFIKTIELNKSLVTICPEPFISLSTICGNNERFENIKIIYFTSLFNNENISLFENNMLGKYKSIISNSTNLFHNNHLTHSVIKPEQYILIGLCDELLDDVSIEYMIKNKITYFTINQMRKKNMKELMNIVNDYISDNKIHIIFDMNMMDAKYVSKLYEFDKLNGMTIHEVLHLFEYLNFKNICGLDITNFDLTNDTKKSKYTIEIGKIILQKLLNINEKKINIFNEHSKFLIFRPVKQEDESDIGWYILRGTSNFDKEKFIREYVDDNIITIVDDDDEDNNIYCSTTTINEQENMICEMASSIEDKILFSDEKVDMMFELINNI